MANVGKDALLQAFVPQDDVELPSGKGTVHVRGLTRWEATEVNEGTDADDGSATTQLLLERRALARGMVDPAMTEDDVEAWQRAGAAADVLAVARRISELSNLDPQGGKGPTSRSKRRPS